MHTTRRRILTYLENHPPASAQTISRALRMTTANIRHHLTRLADDHLIEVVQKNTVLGRGRPTLLYGLTHRAAKGDLRQLTTALWMELLKDLPEEEANRQLHRLAARLLGTDGDSGGSLTQRLYATVRQLRSLDFNARWEARADSPLLILEHCPYAALKSQLPEICSLDKEIVSILLGQPVEQVTEREPNPGGQTHCVFRILPT